MESDQTTFQKVTAMFNKIVDAFKQFLKDFTEAVRALYDLISAYISIKFDNVRNRKINKYQQRKNHGVSGVYSKAVQGRSYRNHRKQHR